MKKIDIGNIFWWVETQRVLVILKLKNGSQYELDGRYFREGVYSVIFRNGKKVDRVKNLDYHLLPKLVSEDVEGVWIYIPKMFWGYWSTKTVPGVLEGLMKNYPEKTPAKELKEYTTWIPCVHQFKTQERS